MNATNIVRQVESLPDLIRKHFDELDALVRRVLDFNEFLSVKRVVVTGCGDSYMAGLATELAFEQIARLPTEPLPAMTAGRYAAPNFEKLFPRNPLVIGVSASGTVARTREALLLARAAGALTLAITGDPASPLATIAEKILPCVVPDFLPAPGVRSYRVSLIALYLLAIRIAEVRAILNQDQANELRRQLKACAEAIEKTIDATTKPARLLAAAVAGSSNFVFVGDGPNYATALFSAAKVIEAAGRHAIGQDTEEWAHLQYFINFDRVTPTFLISPGGRGHARAAELLEPMKRIGRLVVAVVPSGDSIIGQKADWVLPVVGEVPEIFSPMAYAIAGELFSAYLSEIVGEPPFRGFQAPYADGSNTIKNSVVVERV